MSFLWSWLNKNDVGGCWVLIRGVERYQVEESPSFLCVTNFFFFFWEIPTFFVFNDHKEGQVFVITVRFPPFFSFLFLQFFLVVYQPFFVPSLISISFTKIIDMFVDWLSEWTDCETTLITTVSFEGTLKVRPIPYGEMLRPVNAVETTRHHDLLLKSFSVKI